MCKKRFTNAALSLCLIAATLLGACARAQKATDPDVRGIGYVRVDEVLKHHPLYGQLSKIDDSIDALNLDALGAGAVPLTGAQIAVQTRELNKELQDAETRANQILRQKQADYARREQEAINAALASAGAGTNGSGAAAAMQNVSSQQAQQVAASANRDFAQYQQSVLSQSNSALAAINRQLSDRANRSLTQRATQYQERESQYALELSQQDASKRLQIRMKLGNLALSDTDRKSLRDQLAALDKREQDAVGAQRARDRQDLEAYRAQLHAQVQRDLASEQQRINADTQSKLQARHNEVSQQVASQLQGLQSAPIPQNLPASTRDRIAAIDRQFKEQFRADAQRTVAQYQATKTELDARYQALQGADGAANGLAGGQLRQLQRQRDDLYSRMVDQIKREAGVIATKRGLQVVFVNVKAAPGGIDLTDDVSRDIESLHE